MLSSRSPRIAELLKCLEVLVIAFGKLFARDDDFPKTLEDAVSRKWTSGKFTVMAKLVAIGDDKVTLKTDKGKEVVVPRKKLSEGDHEYLKAFE